MILQQRVGHVLVLLFITVPATSWAQEINLEENPELYSRDFYTVPTTVKTYENDTVLLPCAYKLSYLSVRWLRDEDFIMESPQSEPIFMDRFHLLANGSLEVMNVQPEDTGKYYCEIVTDSGKAVQVHAIEVQYPPRIYTTPSGVIELPIGAVLEVICEAEGVPQPAVTWTHNNDTIIDYLVGNRQIHVVEIKSRNMSGKIECTGQNGVGQAVSDGLELIVLFSPEIHTARKIYYSKMGGRLQLDCLVESAPLAKLRWFHAGKPISYGPYFGRQDSEEFSRNLTQQSGGQQRYYYEMKHSLIIKNARESDMGMYECRAENTIGIESAYMEVTFRPMPCTFKISPEMQSPTAHILVWQTESYSPIIEFKLKFRQVPSDSSYIYSTTTVTTSYAAEWTELTIPSSISIGPIYTTTYTLHGLHPASIYQVVVLARNHYGWSDSSKILRFATGGEVEFPNYSTESDQFDLVNNRNTINKGSIKHQKEIDDDDDEIYIRDDLLSNKTVDEITENYISPLKDLKAYATVTFYASSSLSSTGYGSSKNWWWLANAFVVIIGYKLY